MSDPTAHTEPELIEQLRAIDVRAPQALHTRIGELVAAAPGAGRSVPSRRAPRRGVLAGRLAGAVALAALAAVLLVAFVGGVGGGGGTRPVLPADVALTLAPATAAAPSERPGDGGALTASVDGLAFPYWDASFGWRSTGARSDRLGGYPVTTVFYANGRGQRIGYAILGGPPPSLQGSAVSWHDGTAYHLLSLHGATVVAWLRDGRLCVIAGRNVGESTLVRLAGWSNGAAA